MATKNKTVDVVIEAFSRSLDPKVRMAVVRRHDAMLRELAFLTEKEDKRLLFIRKHKWTEKKLSVLFSLNCIYQEVLGPLDASARSRGQKMTDNPDYVHHGLGSTNPIVHGSQRFDAAHTTRVKSAVDEFFEIVSALRFRRDWMTKNTCADLVYWIERHERERLGEDGDANS